MANDSLTIRCPSCGAEYDLPESFKKSLLGSKVTCASCSRAWIPLPDSGLLARLRQPRELPIDLIAYQRSGDLFAGLGSVTASEASRPAPAPEAAPAAATVPAAGSDIRARLPASPPADGSHPAAALETMLDLGASPQQAGLSLENHLRRLDVAWTGMDAFDGKRFQVTKSPVVIGRAGVDMNIPYEKVSKKHAKMEVAGPNHFLLVDLASTNGTVVNDRPITTASIKNGDVVSFGGAKFKFTVKAR